MTFWDIFLIDGMVSVYKVALIFLSQFEDRIMHMPFEQSLQFIQALPKAMFSKDDDSIVDEITDEDKFNI